MSGTTQISVRLPEQSMKDIQAIQASEEPMRGKRPSRAEVIALALREKAIAIETGSDREAAAK